MAAIHTKAQITLGELPLHTYIEYHRKRYRIRRSYDVVLQAMRALRDENLLPHDRQKLAVQLLIYGKIPNGHIADLCEAAFTAILGADQQKVQRKVMSFVQDADLIYAAFWQTYGIDLDAERGRLDWSRFLALLSGLPDDTRFMQVIGIRAQPMPKATKYNGEERARIAKLKAQYALHLTEEERAQQWNSGLQKVAAALIGMAEEGSKQSQKEENTLE